MPKDYKIIELRSDINPWEHQGGAETTLMYSRFLVFRDLGPESDRLRQALEVLNSSGDKLTYSTIKDYSSAFRWTPRAAAWDRYNVQAERARMVRRRRRAIDDMCRAAERLRAKGLEALQGIDIERLSAADIVRMIDLAHRIESSVYSEYAETPANARDVTSSGVDAKSWSPDQRRKRLEELRVELTERTVRAVDDDEVIA